MLVWDRYGFRKKLARTHYSKLVLLHSVGSMGHVVHFGAPGAQTVDARFFIIGWDRYGLHKKRARTHYGELVFLHPAGSADDVVNSTMSGA
jgi:hypothetical protein